MPDIETDRFPARDRAIPIFSWAMYDFANTIYSAVVVTAFITLFLSKLVSLMEERLNRRD